MLSKIKKSVAVGLSAVLAVSLSCGVCAAKENDPDTGCSRVLVDDWHDPCLVANIKCARTCFDATLSREGKTPAFCGEQQIDAIPSKFLGCNEEFQKCMSKPLTFWKKLRFNSPFYFGMAATAGFAVFQLLVVWL